MWVLFAAIDLIGNGSFYSKNLELSEREKDIFYLAALLHFYLLPAARPIRMHQNGFPKKTAQNDLAGVAKVISDTEVDLAPIPFANFITNQNSDKKTVLQVINESEPATSRVCLFRRTQMKFEHKKSQML